MQEWEDGEWEGEEWDEAMQNGIEANDLTPPFQFTVEDLKTVFGIQEGQGIAPNILFKMTLALAKYDATAMSKEQWLVSAAGSMNQLKISLDPNSPEMKYIQAKLFEGKSTARGVLTHTETIQLLEEIHEFVNIGMRFNLYAKSVNTNQSILEKQFKILMSELKQTFDAEMHGIFGEST